MNKFTEKYGASIFTAVSAYDFLAFDYYFLVLLY